MPSEHFRTGRGAENTPHPPPIASHPLVVPCVIADSSSMSAMEALETDRLFLRRWHDADREPFARMNADRVVMEYFPAPLSKPESDRLIDAIEAHFARHGFGLWAAELRATGGFIGYIGLAIPRFEAAFTPCVEIGWRLDAAHWGKGLATEGAQAILLHAFGALQLNEIVS